MKNIQRISTICFATLLLIPACGGGSSGGGIDTSVTRNATLDSTDDAARVIAAFALADNLEGPDRAFETFGQDDVCNQGGDTEGSSFSGNAINFKFNDCDTRLVNGTETIDTLLNGRVHAICNDGFAACNNLSATIGEGSSPLMADVQIQENGVTTTDLISELLGDIDIVSTETANTERTVTNSTLYADIQDELNNRAFTLRTDELQTDVTENTSTEVTSTAVNGSFSLNGLTNCMTGGVDIATISPIQSNADNETLSGEVELTNNNGQVATVEFLNSNGVRITANGTTRDYSLFELSAFCN